MNDGWRGSVQGLHALEYVYGSRLDCAWRRTRQTLSLLRIAALQAQPVGERALHERHHEARRILHAGGEDLNDVWVVDARRDTQLSHEGVSLFWPRRTLDSDGAVVPCDCVASVDFAEPASTKQARVVKVMRASSHILRREETQELHDAICDGSCVSDVRVCHRCNDVRARADPQAAALRKLNGEDGSSGGNDSSERDGNAQGRMTRCASCATSARCARRFNAWSSSRSLRNHASTHGHWSSHKTHILTQTFAAEFVISVW